MKFLSTARCQRRQQPQLRRIKREGGQWISVVLYAAGGVLVPLSAHGEQLTGLVLHATSHPTPALGLHPVSLSGEYDIKAWCNPVAPLKWSEKTLGEVMHQQVSRWSNNTLSLWAGNSVMPLQEWHKITLWNWIWSHFIWFLSYLKV